MTREENQNATRGALQRFVQTALKNLQVLPVEGMQSSMMPPTDTWVRGGDGCYHLRPLPTAAWQNALLLHTDRIEGLAEYKDAVSAVQADAEIGPQLGGLVGTALSATIAEANRVPLALLWQTARRVGDLRFDVDAFAQAYDEFASFWLSTTIIGCAFVPLNGLRAANLPLQLGAGVTLVELTDAEVSAAILFGVIRPMLPQRTRQIAPLCGLRLPIAYEKRHTASDQRTEEKALEAALQVQRDVCDTVDRSVQGLRVFKAGHFSAPMTIFETRVGATTHVAQPRMSDGREILGAGYVILPADSEPLRDLLRCCDQPTARWLGTALRRFDYASARSRPDDKITDLMIAAEAMFLYEMGPEQRGELSFRLALRAAHYIDDAPTSRPALLKFFQKAYSVRSKLVHGAEPNVKSLKGLAGETIDLAGYVAVLEGLIRSALGKAIRSPAPDWEELAFRGRGSLGS